VTEVTHHGGVMLEGTGNQNGSFGDVLSLDCRGLDRLAVDPAF
jgi:hypothetical protein